MARKHGKRKARDVAREIKRADTKIMDIEFLFKALKEHA